MRARLWAVVVGGVLALVFLACATGGTGNGSPADEKFIRKCTAAGKVPHITHRGGSTSRSCDPAPQPSPHPGDRWQ